MNSPLVEKLDRLFYPNVVAVVGAKQLNNYLWLRNVQTFKGKVYHVNIDRNEWPGAEALGFTNVASLHDITEPVDYVIVSVPNKVVPAVLRDCIAKGVGGVHLFTAGFAEIGTEEGRQLEHAVVEMARKADLPLIGPNCMGIFHPEVGLRQFNDQYTKESGPMGYISQSGSQAIGFSLQAHAHGIDISKSISFGNGIILDSTDFLDYLSHDEDTRVVGMYLEGIRDGRRFHSTLKAAASKKPVLIWKVGTSEEAARAGVFHSGSLAVPSRIWASLMRQCGAIAVSSVEEMVDTAKALLFTTPAAGARLALIALSGGHASEMTEAFARAGFQIPSLGEESLKKIAAFAELVGGSFHNPIEGPAVRTEENVAAVLAILAEDPAIDTIAMELAVGRFEREAGSFEARLATLREFREKWSKPVVALLTTSFPYTDTTDIRGMERQLASQGIASFPGFQRGAAALMNAVNYYRFRESADG